MFTTKGNHFQLLAIHPAGERDQQHLPADGVEHPPSLLATAAIGARPNFRIVRGGDWSIQSVKSDVRK